MDERELLNRYAVHYDQEAFRQLVQLHMDWVYGCARRIVQDPGAAEDVVQAVFILLARKAGTLRRGTHLAGWLFRATRYCASEAMRGKARRLKHEREAAMLRNETTVEREANWDEIRPVVDEAVAALGSTDRDAVLVRFFQGKSLQEVGQTLGLSEEAAKKRLQRAVAKLRAMLQQRGVSTSAGALTGVMAMNLGEHAPATLVEAAVHSATAAGAPTVAAGLAKGTQTLFVMAKVKAAAVVLASAVILGGGTAAVVSGTSSAAATEPFGPAVAAETLDAMYEGARPSSPDLEITAGPNRFRVIAVVRWDGERVVWSDGRGGGWQPDLAMLKQVAGPRYASEDVAVVFVDTPPERFDARRLRLFDHDKRRLLQDTAITRVPGVSAFRIARWFAPLPERIDLWLDLGSYAAESRAAVLEPRAGACATVGDATVRIRDVRAGRWVHTLTRSTAAPAGIQWGKQRQEAQRTTVVLDCTAPSLGGPYQIAAVAASGRKAMSDVVMNFTSGTPAIHDFVVTSDELAGIELRPLSWPGPFYFDGIVVPARITPVAAAVAPPVTIEGQWDAMLSSGPTVTIVAVNDPERPDRWWMPDGEPTDNPGTGPDRVRLESEPPRMERTLCLRVTDVPKVGHVRVGLSDTEEVVQTSAGEWIYVSAAFPLQARAAIVSVEVSTEPWQVVEEFPLDRKGWLKTIPMYVHSVRQSQGKALLVLDESLASDGMLMEFVDAKGKAFNFTAGGGVYVESSDSGLPYRHVLEFGNITAGPNAIRVYHRPVETVQFNGVRLNPK